MSTTTHTNTKRNIVEYYEKITGEKMPKIKSNTQLKRDLAARGAKSLYRTIEIAHAL